MVRRIQKFKRVQHTGEPGDIHELTFSCYRNRAFLARERTCLYLAEALLRACRMHRFDLWAYVFMPEHVHMLVWATPEASDVSDFLLSLKQSVSRRAVFFLRKNNPDGLRLLATGQKHSPYHFWQDGSGYDRILIPCKVLHASIDYIHANPVRRGLVAYPEDWKWSSAKDWSGLGRGPIPLDTESFPMV